MAEAVKGPGEEMDQKLEPKLSQDEGESQKATASPPRHQRRSADHSPMHRYYQAKLGAKGNGVSSPSWERKSSSDSSHGLAGRSRMKSTPRGNETPEKGASVPKFGDWNESDPSSADGYSQIFNLVREERKGGLGSTPSVATHNDKFRNSTSKKLTNSVGMRIRRNLSMRCS